MFANTMYVPGLIHFYVYLFAGALAGLYGNGKVKIPAFGRTNYGLEMPINVRHARIS
jgi:hypothetical protein